MLQWLRYEVGVEIYFFPYRYPVVTASFVDKTAPLLLNGFGLS